MPTFLNWETGLGQVTLDTSTDILIPTQPATYGGTTDTIDFLIKRLGDPKTGIPILDAEGNVQYILNEEGSKVASGYELYRTTNGDDDLWIRSVIPGEEETFSYALYLTTIRLGGGNDSLRLYGEGITQASRTEISLDSAAGYVFQSNIFGGSGNDYIGILLAWQSTIKGGSNQIYYDAVNTPTASIPAGGIGVTLTDELTLEEVPYGDTLALRGSRADWDLEFYDGNGDGSVTLASLLNESDYIATSNNNKIWGFERLLFGDYLFDLVLYRQQPSSAIYGQPEYFLFGQETAPTLNSSIGADIWQAFRFNRTKIGGIEGAGSLYRITVSTGKEDDTPYIDGALSYADLSTEDGNDIVLIQSAREASLSLGSGNDQLAIVNGLLDSTIRAGAGLDSIRVGSSTNAVIETGVDGEAEADSIEIKENVSGTQIRTGGGNDSISIRGAYAINSVFDGGAGAGDIILLSGIKSSYGLTLIGDSSSGFVLRDKNNSEYRNIELLAFSDGTFTASQLITELSTAAATPPPEISDQADEETLRTDVSPAEWSSRNYDALVFRGVSGTEVRDLTIRTGSGNNRVSLNDALAFAALDTGDGDDLVRIDTQEARDKIKPFVQFGRAVYNADISLGNGDDILNAQSDGNTGFVPGSPLNEPGYENPDYFQSSIDAGPGNDYIYGFLPYASTFDGGTGTDTLLLYGTRADWDLEFIYDINGNINYILAAGIGGFNIAKDNKIRNFEFFQFNDVLLNLASPPQDNSLDFFGQDLLTRTLPELNSSVTAPLWDGLAFNRLRLTAVRGLPTAPITINTGAGNDTPNVVGAIEDVTFQLGLGNDVFKAGSALRAKVFGEAGSDLIEIAGTFSKSEINSGAGADYIKVEDVIDSTITAGEDAESENDTLEITGALSNSTLKGGGGNGDTLLIQGNSNDSLEEATDSQGKNYLRYGTNRIYGFENISIKPDPNDGGFISRNGLKGSIGETFDTRRIEAQNGKVYFKVDNQASTKNIYIDGILTTVFDANAASANGYGIMNIKIAGTERPDVIDAKGYGNTPPIFRDGFRISYDFPDYFNASVETLAGDDEVSAYFPFQSKFDGGIGKDTIILYGTKKSYNLSFAEPADLEQVLFRDINGNEYKGFETFQFSDLTISRDDLIKQLTENTEPPVIEGAKSSPTIRSNLNATQWIAGNNDSLIFNGIAGLENAPISIDTGSNPNRVSLDDAISWATLNTGTNNDLVFIDVQTARDKPYVQQGYAVFNSTISLGAGNDTLNAQSAENGGTINFAPENPLNEPGYTRPDYYQSTINAGDGDDYIYGFLPFATNFIGGTGFDSLLLYGTRADWDLEFRYTPEGQLDYILAAGVGTFNIAKDNKIYGFEVLQFNDVRLDLTAPPADSSADAFGQGLLARTLPELNSSVTASLWDGLAFNRLSIASVKGLPTAPITIDTGAGNDTPTMEGSITDVTFRLGSGNDVLRAGSALRANILGQTGDDLIEIRELMDRSSIEGGSGSNYIKLKDVQDSTIRAGSDSETQPNTVEVDGELTNTIIYGSGGTDRLILNETLATTTPKNPNAVDANGVKYYQLGSNRFYGFETINFVTPTVDSGGNGGTGTGTGGDGGGTETGTGGNTNQPSSSEPIEEQLFNGGIKLDARNVSTGSQTLSGTGYEDIIFGSAAADIIWGKKARDILTGGKGDDAFRYNFKKKRDLLGKDKIVDFTPGRDNIEIFNVSPDSQLAKALQNKQPTKKQVQTFATRAAAKKSSSLFAFASETGELFYNQNLGSSGFGGGGGLIAELTPGLRFSAGDLIVAYL